MSSMDKPAIRGVLTALLVAGQFPEWADLPVTPIQSDGNDHTTFRLGEKMSVRLPSADRYEPQVDKEH
jgi:aminoglycoside phosphotransferase (APT) family kinase protein